MIDYREIPLVSKGKRNHNICVVRLDCGCIYYQRVFRDGELDTQVGIYRDADEGSCEICLLQEDNWTDRVIDETVIYSSQFQIETV